MITNDDSDLCSRILLYPTVTPTRLERAGFSPPETPEYTGHREYCLRKRIQEGIGSQFLGSPSFLVLSLSIANCLALGQSVGSLMGKALTNSQHPCCQDQHLILQRTTKLGYP